jgi:hypothetical protein
MLIYLLKFKYVIDRLELVSKIVQPGLSHCSSEAKQLQIKIQNINSVIISPLTVTF